MRYRTFYRLLAHAELAGGFVKRIGAAGFGFLICVEKGYGDIFRGLAMLLATLATLPSSLDDQHVLEKHTCEVVKDYRFKRLPVDDDIGHRKQLAALHPGQDRPGLRRL
jgi:hypothetical protein